MEGKQRNPPLSLRLDLELAKWVKDRAKAGDRSLNAEINRLIRQAKEEDEQKTNQAA